MKHGLAKAARQGVQRCAESDEGARGDRSKRLLDLVMILLRARTPVTYREIRDQFVAYQTLNVEAGLRAFERDKADLLDLGVPIRYVTPDEDDSLEDGGYVIDLKRFKMPEVRLTARRNLGARARRVGRARDAGWRVSQDRRPRVEETRFRSAGAARYADRVPAADEQFADGARPFPEKSIARPELAEIYATLEAATRFHKRVTLTYQTATTAMTSGAISIRTRWFIAKAPGSSSAGVTCATRSARSASTGSARP